MADELMRTGKTVQHGASYFDGQFVPQLGRRLLGFLLFPCIPVGALIGMVSVMGSSGLLAAIIIGVVLCVICGSVAAALRLTWSVNHSLIEGNALVYNGSFGTAVWLYARTALLTIVTLGLYWLLGFGSVALNRGLYRNAAIADGRGDASRSGFTGNFLHLIVPRVVVTAIPFIIMYMTGLIKQVGKPAIGLWGFLCNIADNGLITTFRDVAFRYHTAIARTPPSVIPPEYADYNVASTLIWTGIMLFVAVIVLLPWYRFKMTSWEINNTVIVGHRMKYNAKMGDYYLFILLNTLLTLATAGLWIILGFNRLSMWKFRVRYTSFVKPSSALASPEDYMVPPGELNRSWGELVRAVFNTEARKKAGNYTRRYWTLYLLLLVPVVYIIIFKYIPMLYIQIGVKQNNIVLPIWDVSWGKQYGFEWFITAFQNRDFLLALRNTVMLNGLDLIVGFPAPIILAILLNELTFRRFKRLSQTIFYMPHFLSWVIIASMALQLFDPTNGLVNILLEKLGASTISPFSNPFQWVVMFVLLGVWHGAGWGTIIYLAAITNINPELYEAAEVDGAGRMRKIWHITLPGLRPTIIVLLIMRMGSILGSDFERPFALKNPLIQSVADGLSIYVYTFGIKGSKFSLTAAVGIFQSIVCLIFLFAANGLAKKFGERGVW